MSGARWRDLALAGLAFALQALSSAYHAVFAAVTVVVFLGWLVAPAGRPPLGRLFARGLVAGALVLCVLVPLFVPYAIVRDEAGLVRDLSEVRLYSATPASYLAAPPLSRWLGGPTVACHTPFMVAGSNTWYTPDFWPSPTSSLPVRSWKRLGDAPKSRSMSMHEPRPCG